MDWMRRYKGIADRLGLDVDADYEAALVLDGLIEACDLSRLSELIYGRRVVVFGAGPSLKKGVLFVKEKRLHRDHIFIAADGAVSALLEEEILPDVVVSDLDGNLGNLIEANRLGSLTVIHAHGDNIKILRQMVPLLRGVVGTTQVKPMGKMHNFGGFTDGDRCVYLAVHFGAEEILLCGMDFGEEVGEYSGTYRRERKLEKLRIAKELIEELIGETDIPIKKMDYGCGDGPEGI